MIAPSLEPAKSQEDEQRELRCRPDLTSLASQVHARPSEDGPVTEVVIQTNGDISTRQPPPEDWISKRRNGLAIQFREEGPRAPSYWLRIYQHKGVTYIEWSEDE